MLGVVLWAVLSCGGRTREGDDASVDAGEVCDARPSEGELGWHAEGTGRLSTGYTLADASLALDDRGIAHLVTLGVYVDNATTTGDTAFRTNSGGAWHVEWQQGSFDNVIVPALALDEAGDPHLSFTTEERFANLVHAVRRGGFWSFDLADTTEHYGYSSIAVGADDVVHVLASNDQEVRHIERDGAGWSSEVLYPTMFSIPRTGPVVVVDGEVRVAYVDPRSGALRYAWRTDAVWSDELLRTDGTSGAGVLLTSETPSLLVSTRKGSLELWTRGASGWTSEPIAQALVFAGALDSESRIHVAWLDTSAGLHHSLREAWAWREEPVDVSDRPPERETALAFALDPQDRPHFVYAHRPIADLGADIVHVYFGPADPPPDCD